VVFIKQTNEDTMLTILNESMSESRMNTYTLFLNNKNIYSDDNVLLLYLINIRLSSNFLKLLNFYEIILKNSIQKALKAINVEIHTISFGRSFIQHIKDDVMDCIFDLNPKINISNTKYNNNPKLKNKPREISYQSLCNNLGRLDKKKIQYDLIDCRAVIFDSVNNNDIIAALKLKTWENLVKHYKNNNSSIHINDRVVFAQFLLCNNLNPMTMDSFIKTMKSIRIFRNRICHCEPIFNQGNLLEMHENIFKLIKCMGANEGIINIVEHEAKDILVLIGDLEKLKN